MLLLILFVVQLVVLFLLARSFTNHFFRMWYLLTTSKSWAVRLTSVCLLPGTLVHELSHWLVAELLRVPTGEMKLIPELVDGEGIRMGSVMVGKTDVFRQTLIGLAPLGVGLLCIGLAVHFIPNNWTSCRELSCFSPVMLIILVVFMVSNTMFSSKKDLDAAFVPFALVVILGFAFWWFDWQLPTRAVVFFEALATKMNYAFAVTIVINICFLLSVQLLTRLTGKLFKRRLVG